MRKLIIFVKAPRPGTIKTRLARSMGDAAARSAYLTLVSRLLENLRSFEHIEFRYAPDDAEAEIQCWLRDNWIARPQGSGDLGARLLRAFSKSFAEGYSRVVVIGSDCPFVLPKDIEAAFQILEDNDAVIGPARDGGYWLLGLQSLEPSLFENMIWSTSAVLTETERRLQKAGRSYQLLRELDDIDEPEDWLRFQRQALNP